MELKNMPIGFFDSGVGGISVLKEAMKLLPKENFIYYGDSKNAPYGTKTVEEVRKLTFDAVNFMIDKGVKAIVIACNTATSAAIEDLRLVYKFTPIIGIEPALKPAVELNRKGKIIIMATPMTLAEKKFNDLMCSYGQYANIQPLPCAGLVELIEAGTIEGDKVNNYLKNKLNDYLNKDIAAIVLGCTHYPFIKNELLKILPKDTPIIDGSIGTSKQLERQLSKTEMLNEVNIKGEVEIFNSLQDEEIIELSRRLLYL